MKMKWAEIRIILAEYFEEAQLKVWVDSLLPVWEEDSLTLHAASSFMAGFIRQRFLPAIESAVKSVCGQHYAVFVVSQSKNLSLNPSEISLGGTVPMKVETHKKILLEKDSSMQHSTDSPKNEIIQSVSQNKPQPRPLVYDQLPLPLEAPVLPKIENFPWRYRFEDFVTGPCNQMAYTAAQSLCDGLPGVQGLFLHSATGLGKTHLIQAVGSALNERCNRAMPRMRYLSGENFAAQYVHAMQHNAFTELKARYHSLDFLLFEDVHFLQNKTKFQICLLEIIKEIYERGGRVVFTSSFAVQDLRNMEDQLLSRLSGGFLTSINRPDKETRRQIFRHKARKFNLLLSEEVEDVLAEHIHSDVRQIESCLQNLLLKARLHNSGVTLPMAYEIIGQYCPHETDLSLEGIAGHVARLFGLNKGQMLSQSRKKQYVQARNVAFLLARKHTDLSLETIGNFFNRRHSTVLQGITRLEQEIARQTSEGQQLSNIISMVERNGRLSGDSLH